MKGGVSIAQTPGRIAPHPGHTAPTVRPEKRIPCHGGGWGHDLPNRNAAPEMARPARLICGEGDDSGLGVSGSPRGDRQPSPIQGISTRLRFRHRLLTRSTRSPCRMPLEDNRVASHNCDYIQIPCSGDVTWASWMVSGVMSTGGGRRPGLT